MADYEFIVETGVVVPDTADLRDNVETEWKAAFGADFVTTADTPQGVMITGEALARDAVARNNADLANQINPNLAGGTFLDAIAALTGLERVVATRSVLIAVNLTGVPGALVPEGSRARVGMDGPIFESTGAVVFDGTGAASVNFQSVDYGPIPAAATALGRIVSPALGWETVSNPSAAVLGAETETDLAFRQRRRDTLAIQGTALPVAITSGLFDTPDVSSVLFRENTTSSNIVEDGVTILPHSVLAVVDGGLDSDVAETLLRNKSLGCDWTGTTTVPTVEPVSGQTYQVKFTRPASVAIYASVTVRVLSAGGNPAQAVRDAITAYAAGLIPGEPGLVIGQDVSPFELAGAVNRLSPDLYVSALTVGLSSGSLDVVPVPIAINQRARIIDGNIVVIVT